LILSPIRTSPFSCNHGYSLPEQEIKPYTKSELLDLLEHNFGKIGLAMKNYYYLLQIAHLLHQLMIRSDLFPKLQKKIILQKFA